MSLLKRTAAALLPVVLLVAGPGAGMASPSACHRVPSSVDATGTRNVTARLQAFIDSVPDDACVSFPKRGRFRAEGSIQLVDRHGLTINGNGSTVFATTHGPAWPLPGRKQLVILGGSQITVRALRIRSINTTCAYVRTYEFEAGVGINGATDVRLVNMSIRNVSGDFVYIDARFIDGQTVTPTDIAIVNSPKVDSPGRFRCSGRQGIAAGSGQGLVFRNLRLERTALIPFDLETMPEQEIRGVGIIGNTVEAPFGAVLIAAASVYGSGTHDVTVRGNRILGRPMSLLVDNSTHTGWSVVGNTSDTQAWSRLVVLRGNVQGFVFRGNVQPFNALGDGRVLHLDSVGCADCAAGYGNPCDVVAGSNRLVGAEVLFFAVDGQEPCDWLDEGDNLFI